MLKILVADDEVLERKALTKIISSSLKNVTVIGEALNGRKAIEMAKQHRPDIIFMDIKMPGVDGVQAVKEIKKLDPDIRFIMVSAYNTFEYAKEVMQQGVKEYILKPSRKQDICESLERVIAEIMAERKQRQEHQSLRESLDKALSIAQKEWVASLLINQVQDISFEEWSQLLGTEITSGYIMLVYFQAGKDYVLSETEKQELYLWLRESLRSNVRSQEFMIGPMTQEHVPVLFLCEENTEKGKIKVKAQSIVESLFRDFVRKTFQAELKIAVGLRYQQASRLNQSYHDAVLALEKLHKTPKRRYLFWDKREPMETPTVAYVLELEKKLLDTVRQGDVNQVLHTFETYIKKLADTEGLKPATLKKFFDELFVLLTRMLHDLGINEQRVPVIKASDSLTEILEMGKENLLAIVQAVQLWRNHHAKGMLQKAKEYIESHYSETLSLEQVAEYVELSPFYFSKLFKDRFGMTFIDYLTEIRINKAKAEMMDQGKSLKEICYSIGYKDPNYFSRVFKKQTGLSPSEFRKAIANP